MKHNLHVMFYLCFPSFNIEFLLHHGNNLSVKFLSLNAFLSLMSESTTSTYIKWEFHCTYFLIMENYK